MIGEGRTITMREWTSRRFPGLKLSPAARRLIAKLQREDRRRVLIEELAEGVRIQTFAHVGVVQLATFSVRILPKLIGGESLLAAMIDHASGVDALRRFPRNWLSAPKGASLLDLYALLFLSACEQLLSDGLLFDYVEHEDALTKVRGRIRFREQMSRRFGRVDVIECRYDEPVTDIWENQLLALGLAACARLVRSEVIRARARRLFEHFRIHCSPARLSLRGLRRRRNYHRLNAHYEEVHELALLILDALGIEQLEEVGRQPVCAFLIDMNRLFEGFLERILSDTLADVGWTVKAQHSSNDVIRTVPTGNSYATLRPDYLLEDLQSATRVPVDAKYKLYDDTIVANSDIYQTAIYGLTLGEQRADHAPVAMLLYPSSADTNEQVVVQRPQDQQLVHLIIQGVPLEQLVAGVKKGHHVVWPKIHESLFEQ